MALDNLTIVIIAKDEEKLLPDCLASIGDFAKVLLIDTGSSDKTIDIAKKHGAAIVKYVNGKSFSDWRNKGMSESKSDWILYLDADERLTPALKSEITKIILEGNESAYAIPRENIILGKKLHHGGWYPDYQKRLFKKVTFKKWHGQLHEEPEFEGGLGHLKNPMTHNKHETFTEMVEKTNNWSEVEGKLMFDASHPPMNVPRFLTAMWREFWYRMIVKQAFLDGKIGIMFAMYQVFSRFVSYAKLWEFQITDNKSGVTN